MTLREYLFINRRTAAAVARELGINEHYFRQICRGKLRPGYELATKIELMTGGEVTMNEFRP